MPYESIFWWLFAGLSVAGGLGMVILKNPVGSLLSLVTSFFGLAAIYVILGAHFIAAIQIILYAGAIMVLFLFTIMLLNLGHDYRRDMRSVGWVAAGGVAAGVMGWVLFQAFDEAVWPATAGEGLAIELATRELGAVGAIAFPLFQEWVVAFELTSLLLLVAAVGAVLLAKRRV